MFTISFNEDGSATVAVRHCDGTVSDVVISHSQCGVLDVEVDPATSVRPNVTLGAKDLTKMWAAAVAFLEAWDDEEIAEQVGEILTSSEVWPLEKLFTVAGMPGAAEAWERANEDGSAEAVEAREAAEAEEHAVKARGLRAVRMAAAVAATQVLFRYTTDVTHAALFDREELEPILAEMRSTLGEVDEHELLAKLDQAGMLVDRSKEKAWSTPVLRSFDLEGK